MLGEGTRLQSSTAACSALQCAKSTESSTAPQTGSALVFLQAPSGAAPVEDPAAAGQSCSHCLHPNGFRPPADGLGGFSFDEQAALRG